MVAGVDASAWAAAVSARHAIRPVYVWLRGALCLALHPLHVTGIRRQTQGPRE